MGKIINTILLMVLIFLVACSQSPKEKIVGHWMTVDEDPEWGFAINADGTIFEIHNGSKFEFGIWKINDKEPLILNIFENDKLQNSVSIRFINDNELELVSRGKPVRMKRK